MFGCIKIKSNFKLRWVKLLFFLLLNTIMTAKSNTDGLDILAEFNLKNRNMLVNILIKKLIAYIRHTITQGSSILGIPILDPLEMRDFHLVIPTGLFNLDLRLKNISVIGFGGFILHKSILHLSNLTFEMEVSLPRVVLSAEMMHISEIDNDYISSVPFSYNKEKPELEIIHFRLQASLQLKQSDDERSILIDKIEDAFFDIPYFKINSNGAFNRDFDILSNLEEGLMEYANSCKDAVLKFISNAILSFGNPVLNRLDTWRYISVLL